MRHIPRWLLAVAVLITASAAGCNLQPVPPSQREIDEVMAEVAELSTDACMRIASTDFWPPEHARIERDLEQMQALGLLIERQQGAEGAEGMEEIAGPVLEGVLGVTSQWRRVRAIEATGDLNEAMDELHGPLARECGELLDALRAWRAAI